MYKKRKLIKKYKRYYFNKTKKIKKAKVYKNKIFKIFLYYH